MKTLTIQDISCYGQCSITVALPILSSYGIETVILPSAILSTHTTNFKNYTVLDLTSEMPKIINHWINEKISFDAIYTGYISDVKQFDIILKCKNMLLKENGLFIVDPAMADNGKLYPALKADIIDGMKQICKKANYIIPNISEACFLCDYPFKEKYDDEYINDLLVKLIENGYKNIILTGVIKKDKIGAIYFNGLDKISYFSKKEDKSFHGTGDVFSSIIIANILNHKPIKECLKSAVDFIKDCIKETQDDPTHHYGVKFEKVLLKQKKQG